MFLPINGNDYFGISFRSFLASVIEKLDSEIRKIILIKLNYWIFNVYYNNNVRVFCVHSSGKKMYVEYVYFDVAEQ